MKTYIPLILKKDTETLLNQKYELFLEFAFKNSTDNINAQILLYNKPLQKWFTAQINQLENEFIHKIANNSLAYKTDLELLMAYNSTLRKVLKLFPKKILISIHKSYNPYMASKYKRFNFN